MAYPFASRLAAWCAEDKPLSRDLTRGRSRVGPNNGLRIAEDLGLQSHAIGPIAAAHRRRLRLGNWTTGPVEVWSRSRGRFA